MHLSLGKVECTLNALIVKPEEARGLLEFLIDALR